MFDLGTKLVCINDDFTPEFAKETPHLPKRGHIYTVRDIVPVFTFNPGGPQTETAGVLLEEITNLSTGTMEENAFLPHRFQELHPQGFQELAKEVSHLMAQ